jgi:hypothetical protein
VKAIRAEIEAFRANMGGTEI